MPTGFRDRIGLYVAKKALYDVAVEVFATENPEFEQIWGTSRRRPDRCVEWFGGDATQEPGPIGRNRSRDETVVIESIWYCIVRGEHDAAREAEEYLYDRLGELERHVRYTDPHLGGVVLNCALTRVVVETADVTPSIQQAGHLAAAGVTFEAKIRITG